MATAKKSSAKKSAQSVSKALATQSPRIRLTTGQRSAILGGAHRPSQSSSK
jgi:hypothetical protein